MPSFTVANDQRFPTGTTLYCYPAVGLIPAGPATDSAVVQNNGSATFDGLAYNTRYVAGTSVAGPFVAFLTDPEPEPEQAVGDGITSVDSAEDLPATADGHPVKLVLSDSFAGGQPTLRFWDGSAWKIIGRSGTGGGNTGGDGGTPPNLFVQETRPDSNDLLIDSLWIPLVDSEPAPVEDWEVYLGTGDGNGGNLFIQEDAPTPEVNSLWIPVVDGEPAYLSEWVVFAGRGTNTAIGNNNLYFRQTLPSSPQPGSFLVPLNGDETAKSIDQWRVYS